MRNLLRVSLAGLFLGANLATAFAQATPEQMEMAYNAARNLIPAPADTSKAEAAEATGKQGKVSAMGMEQDIATSAKAQNISEEKLCQTMADAVKQAGAQLPQ